MDKRKLKHQQSIILKDLADLESNIAKSNPENDLEQTFQMLQERLQQRYEALKIGMAMPNQSGLLREIDNLKYETVQITNDPERLKQVHKKVSDLKTEVLFAPSPPKLKIDPLIQLIDHMGMESDSDEESVPAAVTNIRDPVPSQRSVITPDAAVPCVPLDRQHSSHSSARADRQFSDSSERQRVSSTRASDRQSDLDRSRNNSLVSGTSSKLFDADRKPWRSEQKPTEFASADTLLTPGAFTTSQPKPTVTSRPAGQHGAIKPNSPVRRAQSPLQTRSTPIPSSHLSSHHETPVSSEVKQPYPYYNPQTRTIELRDSTPEHKIQVADEVSSQRSIDHLKSTPVRDQYDRDDRRAHPNEIPPPFRVGHSTLPLRGDGPHLSDLCSSDKVRRYFTEVSDMTSSSIYCSVQELYNPSMFFVLSSEGERARTEIQGELFNYITALGRNRPVSKSHAIGKLVLCEFSVDRQWYRACVIDTYPGEIYRVLFIDFGNFEETTYDKLLEIPPDFVKNWPMCVQQCYLSGITTPGCIESWDRSTTEALWDLVSGQNVVVRATESVKEVYGVILEIRTEDGAININEKLVEMGLAEKKKGGEKDQMNGLCTSPTHFSTRRTPVDDSRSTTTNSFVPDSRPPPVSNAFSRITDSRPPPKNFAPVSMNLVNSTTGITDTRNERNADPKGGRRNRKYSSSEEEEEGAVGRPATPENARTPPNPESMRPSGRASFGAGGGPVGRSNVFADQRTRGSRRPENSTIGSSGEEVATRGETSDYNQGTTLGNHGNQYSGRNDNQRWDHAAFRDDGSPPNFTITHKDLENTTASLSEIGKQINDQTFDWNSTSSEPKCPPQFQFVADHSHQSDDPGEGTTPRSTGQRSSSEVVVLGSRDPSDIHSPPSEIAVNHDIDGGGCSMDALEGDELPAASVDTQIPVTLTDALKHIKYDPKSYLLEDLTVETVYASHKAGEHTRMEIESVECDARFLPVVVSAVISPELFYVTVLSNTNITIQEKINESLDVLYSNKRVWQEGDKVTRNVAGEVRNGEVVAVNKNLLEIQWLGGDEQVAREWLPEHLVDETVSLAISAKLKDLPCRVEFAVGEFCTARYTWRPNEHTECVSWYRAMVLHVVRKKSRGPGPGKIIKYHVQYVDYGNTAEVDVKHVRPLPAKFLLFPAQAIPCTLPEIEPKNNDVIAPPGEDVNVFEIEEDEEEDITPFRGQYSQEAISHFRDLVYEERVYLGVEGEVVPLEYGYQADKTVSDSDAVLQFCNGCLPVTISDIIKGKISSFVTEFVSGGYADRILNLESRDLSLHPVSSVAIEDKVKEVERKLALMDDERESTLGVPSVNSELSSEIGSADSLSTFDPMSDDFNSESNLVDNDRNDLGQAVFGQKLSQRTLCRYFSRGRKCYKGDKCKYLHQTKSDFNSVQSRQAMIAVHKPLTPTNDMPIIVQVTSVLTAFHFWAQILPHHINPGEIEMNVAVADPLTQLTEKMNVHYKFRGNRERKYYPAIGELVAVKSRQGDYRRSRVTETDDVGDRKCKVFHVDYGTFEVVPEQSLRLMEPDFVTELPFQAVEMLLADIRPNYSTSVEPVYVGGEEVGNNKEEGLAARDFFLNRVTDNWLVAKVIERVPEGPLLVHLWDTSGGEEARDWRSINKELVDGGHAESIHPLPEELTTDCGTMASSNFHDSD